MLLLDNQKSLFKFTFCLVFIILVTACINQPTKIFQTQSRENLAKEFSPIVLKDKTVVLDARNAFEYNLAHIPQSLNIQWTDFSQSGLKNQGLLTNDLFKEARRLATKGIDLDSEVVVIGNGIKGKGEEGRLAWTLSYLGLRKVEFAGIDHFKNSKLTTHETPPLKSRIMWKPQIQENLIVTREEIRDFIKNPLKQKKFIIDVRSSQEYFAKTSPKGDYSYPDVNAIHIPWNKFLNDDGRPIPKIKNELLSLGIGLQDRIMVISQKSVRSASITLILRKMGFINSGNVIGGYEFLFDK